MKNHHVARVHYPVLKPPPHQPPPPRPKAKVSKEGRRPWRSGSPKAPFMPNHSPTRGRKHSISTPRQESPAICNATKQWLNLRRKEVIQPHLPVRLPCYDLVPIASPTFDDSLQKDRPSASGVAHFHDLTGGVYKARERIHRGVADPRLLATPPSRSRVAGSDPN